ncbi:MAG: hypothetical protein V7K67_31255 [Nostoc sp.]|uniref:hypothetical protein n=1 Tax=Nostoc sp. TaxID=1180 RepID=UPI002FFBCD88
MKNNTPLLTPNPQEFKLRIVWSADGSNKMVAEFSSCKWLPRIGETLVLPIDETRKPNSWRKFKVFDVVYDFQNQTVRVLCSPIKSPTSPDVKSLIQKIKEPSTSDRWEFWEKALEVGETNVMPKSALSKPIENDFGLEYQFSRLEKDVEEDELEALKSQMLKRPEQE